MRVGACVVVCVCVVFKCGCMRVCMLVLCGMCLLVYLFVCMHTCIHNIIII